jgi:nitrogenase molybdenum-iron protein NifN
MSELRPSKKACAVNPLKSSTPLGAALAFLGVERSVPLFHGSQGCTSFALVLAVRHFKESIPLQTTAMNEASTVLGGSDHLEEALLNISSRMKPAFIGVASTALVETRGEDFAGDLANIRRRRPELAQTCIAFAATPDFEGALEDGWAAATSAILRELVEPAAPVASGHINLLPGVHQTPADIEELKQLIAGFGLEVVVLPDVSDSLDGHVPDAYVGTSLGGTRLDDVRRMGRAAHTLAIGSHMAAPARALQELSGVPFTVFDTLTGLAASDALISLLTCLSGRAAPELVRRQRSQLVDALLDGHFWFSGRRVAIGADPDLLYTLANLLHKLGAEVVCAVSSTKNSPLLEKVPCATVLVGDLADLEAGAAEQHAELLITHSHGRQASERLGIPLFRVGFPIFDRLGVQHRASVGYRGTRALVYELANHWMSEQHEHHPEDFAEVLPAAPVVERAAGLEAHHA